MERAIPRSCKGNHAEVSAGGAAMTTTLVIPFKMEQKWAEYKNTVESDQVKILEMVPIVINPQDNNDVNLKLVL